MTGAAEQHPWKFCPACGAAGNDYEGGGNALCFHCGACPYLECADDHLLEERSVVAEGEDTAKKAIEALAADAQRLGLYDAEGEDTPPVVKDSLTTDGRVVRYSAEDK